MDDQIIKAQMEISGEILDIINHKDEMTQSDLQGAIEAQVYNAMKMGRDIYKEINGKEVDLYA